MKEPALRTALGRVRRIPRGKSRRTDCGRLAGLEGHARRPLRHAALPAGQQCAGIACSTSARGVARARPVIRMSVTFTPRRRVVLFDLRLCDLKHYRWREGLLSLMVLLVDGLWVVGLLGCWVWWFRGCSGVARLRGFGRDRVAPSPRNRATTRTGFTSRPWRYDQLHRRISFSLPHQTLDPLLQ